jgi:hypothetical protein
VGFEPTMSNLITSRVQIALGPWRLSDLAPCRITLLTNNDSSAFYSQLRGIVYNLARLTAVWELKFIVFFNFKKGGDLNPPYDHPYASFLLSLVLHRCKFPFYILHHHSRDIPNSPMVVTLLPGIK